MATVNEVQVAPLLRGEVAEKWGIVEFTLVLVETLQRVFQAVHCRHFIAAWLRQRRLWRRRSSTHALVLQNTFKNQAAKQHLENPRHAIRMPIQRTVDEVRQVLARLCQI